jgi:hypothetical protein
MVKIKSLCRKCFAEKGHSIEILPDPFGGNDVYICTKNSSHKYKKEEDGSFTTL